MPEPLPETRVLSQLEARKFVTEKDRKYRQTHTHFLTGRSSANFISAGQKCPNRVFGEFWHKSEHRHAVCLFIVIWSSIVFLGHTCYD